VTARPEKQGGLFSFLWEYPAIWVSPMSRCDTGNIRPLPCMQSKHGGQAMFGKKEAKRHRLEQVLSLVAQSETGLVGILDCV
jgi:hypothetical protein